MMDLETMEISHGRMTTGRTSDMKMPMPTLANVSTIAYLSTSTLNVGDATFKINLKDSGGKPLNVDYDKLPMLPICVLHHILSGHGAMIGVLKLTLPCLRIV